MLFRTRIVSSLEKVLCRRDLDADAIPGIRVLRGAVGSFQIAVQAECNVRLRCEWMSPFGERVRVREVGLVPCCQPADAEDPYVLVHEPGYYPDPLVELTDQSFRISKRHWHSLWITVNIPSDFTPGNYEISFDLSTPDESCYEYARRSITVPVEVLDGVLPEQRLRCTNWFYVDSVVSQHGHACWTEPLWQVLAKYFRNMAEHGTNMVLTPLWTLPLDAVGQERPTVQLLGIRERNGEYQFDFTNLERWIDLASKNGIRYFEMSHAYTQWGAAFTPKIMVETDEGAEQRFGWHVPADAESYRGFLRALMPELLAFLRAKNLQKRCYFHVSDEPVEKDFEAYRRAASFFTALTEDFPVIDALSSIAFYRRGVVRTPVPSTGALEAFMGEAIQERWCYYCSGKDCFPNRYIGLPSLRNRVLGLLLYIYRMDGFLHWGYNGWYKRPLRDFDVNPYLETEGGRFYNSGAGMLVYPGKDGPVDSLRHEVFREAMQDLRALQALEDRLGRERVMEIVQQGVPYPITMSRYPKDTDWYQSLFFRVTNALGAKS